MDDAIRARGNQLLAAGYTVVPAWGVRRSEVSGEYACACPAGSACGKPGKHPWTPTGHQIHVQDHEQWDQICATAEAGGIDLSLAVAVGYRRSVTGPPVRFGVIDVDNGPTGVSQLAQMLVADAPGPGRQCVEMLANAPQERSGRQDGGWHVFIALPYKRVPNVAAIGGIAGLELKGDGSLIHVYPSLHISGQRYASIVPLEHEIPLAPEVLRNLIPDVGQLDADMANDGLTFRCEPGAIANLAERLGGRYPARLRGWIDAAVGERRRAELWSLRDGRKTALNSALFSAAQLCVLGLVADNDVENLAQPPPDGRWDDLVAAGTIDEIKRSARRGATTRPRRQRDGLLVEMVRVAEERGVEIPPGLLAAYRRPATRDEVAKAAGNAGSLDLADRLDDKTYWGMVQALAGVVGGSRNRGNPAKALEDLNGDPHFAAALAALGAFAALRHGAAPGSDPRSLLISDIDGLIGSKRLSPDKALAQFHDLSRDLFRLAGPTDEKTTEGQVVRKAAAENPDIPSEIPLRDVADEDVMQNPNMPDNGGVPMDIDQLNALCMAHALSSVNLARILGVDQQEAARRYVATLAIVAPEPLEAMSQAISDQIGVTDGRPWLARHIATLADGRSWHVEEPFAAMQTALNLTAGVAGTNMPALPEAVQWAAGDVPHLPATPTPKDAFAALALACPEQEAASRCVLAYATSHGCAPPAARYVVAAAQSIDPFATSESLTELLETAVAKARQIERLASESLGETTVAEAVVQTVAARIRAGEDGAQALDATAAAYPSATAATLALMARHVPAAPADLSCEYAAYACYDSAADRSGELESAEAHMAATHGAWHLEIEHSDAGAVLGGAAEDSIEQRLAHSMLRRVLGTPRMRREANEQIGADLMAYVAKRHPAGITDIEEWRAAAVSRAWEHLDDWSPLRGNVGQWLEGSVLRATTHRSWQHDQALSLDANDLAAAIPDSRVDVESQVVDSDQADIRQHLVASAMRRIPMQYQASVRAHYDLGPERDPAEVTKDLRETEQQFAKMSNAIYLLRQTPEMRVARALRHKDRPYDESVAAAVADLCATEGMEVPMARAFVERIESGVAPERAAERLAPQVRSVAPQPGAQMAM
ncbi:MAG: bifunctional DNA primase/polymerase [Acidimicrobiales bacterium]